MQFRFLRFILISTLLLHILPCKALSASEIDIVNVDIRDMIAQKMIIDLRYFCEPDSTALHAPSQQKSGVCLKPMTQLPSAIEAFLSENKLGGVILFSENLVNPNQTLSLIHDLQVANAKGHQIPLYIGLDQEGGRVMRLPREHFQSFLGNMALAAVDEKNAISLTQQTASYTAQALKALGFNLNFAPVLDVNSNPENPIINVRAYSQFPQKVADLGISYIQQLQKYDIAAVAKHFPGHGDTYTDSHLGLPRVDHTLDTIKSVDLYPFAQAINHAELDMIMTAHIQYPELDDSVFRSKDGNKTITPATFSKKILTELLREQMGFDGIIVTDALDMAAISQFYTEREAVMKAFEAGADIALMPFKISTKEEANSFSKMLDDLSLQIEKDRSLQKHLVESYKRIIAHKTQRKLAEQATLSLKKKEQALSDWFQSRGMLTVADNLADDISKASFTQIKAPNHPLFPLKKDRSIYAVMSDKRRCQALAASFDLKGFTQFRCNSLLSETIDTKPNENIIIIGDISPALSFYESREFEGMSPQQRKNLKEQESKLDSLIQTAQGNEKFTILFLQRSPYVTQRQFNDFDAIYASYDYQVYPRVKNSEDKDNMLLFAPSFETFVEVLLDNHEPIGKAPVNLLIE
uniref:glycoside hydrolase family 3 N-terminal domain-containing protein n=1 Tax=Ningiella ruwaisensis TaxID=2364274 RepID=UPI00109F0D14|nr:glycoside hydrolase family 3 protein [Ningiella ruwaisensis]